MIAAIVKVLGLPSYLYFFADQSIPRSYVRPLQWDMADVQICTLHANARELISYHFLIPPLGTSWASASGLYPGRQTVHQNPACVYRILSTHCVVLDCCLVYRWQCLPLVWELWEESFKLKAMKLSMKRPILGVIEISYLSRRLEEHGRPSTTSGTGRSVLWMSVIGKRRIPI